MPKLVHRLPAMKLHKDSGQAVVWFGGKCHYLGKHGSPEAKEKYDRLMVEWRKAQRGEPAATVEQATPKSPQPRPVKARSRRRAKYKAMEPDFINKTELAHHLQCDSSTIDTWIVDGTIPPPHARPGVNHPIWRRSHYKVFLETGEWPREAY